eukprot:CAMPEP_0204381500 /NCGR_PEP_ID=MMETSP0469-20131031/54295_1 /ASSEMBLY_ACC=CAM_ASM_000384 /TAXON_ID=2969 /ORGANISM="Oxyrrhis marina" /LENGTH=43 /DNA_ID= /DNA_START= /DNA_END= /DNA_ORIENTATION=
MVSQKQAQQHWRQSQMTPPGGSFPSTRPAATSAWNRSTLKQHK